MHDVPTTVLDRIDDRPTTILDTPPIWPLTDPDTPPAPTVFEAHCALRQRQTPSLSLLHRVLTGLRALIVRRCGQCGTEPVARPDLSALTIDGRFCMDCIDTGLADNHPAHWCPIDETGL